MKRRADGRYVIPAAIEPFVDLVCYAICGAALAYLLWQVFRAGWLSW